MPLAKPPLPPLLYLQVRQVLSLAKAECFLASTLDEVAWLYNLRGSDVPYNPGELWKGGGL
jgi:hypothetical protein